MIPKIRQNNFKKCYSTMTICFDIASKINAKWFLDLMHHSLIRFRVYFSNFLPNAFCTDSELIVSELSIIEILSTADDNYESLKCLTHLS